MDDKQINLKYEHVPLRHGEILESTVKLREGQWLLGADVLVLCSGVWGPIWREK